MIKQVDIVQESKDCFLDYSEEVLTERAVPNAEDGLLSVQRKIIWTLENVLKMDSKAKFKKCASLVGSTLMTAYYHGDAACYGAMCKMAQEYLMRYPLIDGEGSLGSQEANDMQASPRYTGGRPSKYTDLMMLDYNKNIVPTKETYNGEYQEPVFLPGLFPNALVNGKQTIAVGLAHNSLPNNLTEICDGIIQYIKNNNITIDEIMQYVKGPDFPLGGRVLNGQDIKEAYRTGRSSVSLKIQGDYEIKGDEIIFTSIPFRTYRADIRKQISDNAEELDKYLDGFRDESNVGKNKLVFELKNGVDPQYVLNLLFSLTDLQTTESYNMNYIVNGTPKLCGLLDLIKAYVSHQNNCMIKAAEFDKDKAEKRKHIIEGLLIVIDGIDKAIELIKSSQDKKEAKEKLIQHFNIDDLQADAVLDMKLSRLTKLDKDDLLNELQEKVNIINESNKIINEEEYRNEKLIDKIQWLKDKYGDTRRTEILQLDIPSFSKSEPIIVDEPVIISLNNDSTITYCPKSTYTKPRSNSKAAKNLKYTIETSSVKNILIFTNSGHYFNIPAWKINEKPIDLNGDKIVQICELPTTKSYYITFTKNGLVKKSEMNEINNKTTIKGSAAVKIKDGDELVSVGFASTNDWMLMIGSNNKGIKVSENKLVAQGKNTSGKIGLKVKNGESLIFGTCVSNRMKDFHYDTRRIIHLEQFEEASLATIGKLMI